MADVSRVSTVHCCACLQASTLTSHIQQGDILVSINGVSLITLESPHLQYQLRKPEDITRIIKLAKSPKKVRFLRVIRSVGDSPARGTNSSEIQLDLYETSLLLENVNKSRIPKFVVSKAPVGKTFDPVSSSLFDVVFSYQPSLGIRIRPFKLNCWQEAVPETFREAKPDLSITVSESEFCLEDILSNASSAEHTQSPHSPFSSSSLWKLFECEEALYQSHCYFTGELLKEDHMPVDDEYTRSTTVESTPAKVNIGEKKNLSPEVLSDPEPSTSLPLDAPEPFIVTFQETYAAEVTEDAEGTLDEDDIPPPATVEAVFTHQFSNPMPATVSKIARLSLRRSSDSGTSCESSLRFAALSNLRGSPLQNVLTVADGTPQSARSQSPVSSLGKSVLSGGQYTPSSFSPEATLPVTPRAQSLAASFRSPTGSDSPNRREASPERPKDKACKVTVLEVPNAPPQPRGPLSVRAEPMTPPRIDSPVAFPLTDQLKFESSLQAVNTENELLKAKLESAKAAITNGRAHLNTDLEEVKVTLQYAEAEPEEPRPPPSPSAPTPPVKMSPPLIASAEIAKIGAPGHAGDSLELQKVKAELLILQCQFKEQMILNQVEREAMIADLLRAREIARLLADDLLSLQTERDRATAPFHSPNGKSSQLTDVERLAEVDNKILTHVLPRMVDLEDALSHSPKSLQSEDTKRLKQQMSMLKQISASEKENAELTQRNLDYQAAKMRLGLGSLGSPSFRGPVGSGAGAGTSMSMTMGSGGDHISGIPPWTGSPKSVEEHSGIRRPSRGKLIRSSLPVGGAHKTERPPWWRVR